MKPVEVHKKWIAGLRPIPFNRLNFATSRLRVSKRSWGTPFFRAGFSAWFFGLVPRPGSSAWFLGLVPRPCSSALFLGLVLRPGFSGRSDRRWVGFGCGHCRWAASLARHCGAPPNRSIGKVVNGRSGGSVNSAVPVTRSGPYQRGTSYASRFYGFAPGTPVATPVYPSMASSRSCPIFCLSRSEKGLSRTET
ncbi:MAG: hypothetical protein EA381_03130 [Planctomycetaceae bacterium]|nr:MAG: hypothetical protein EA381_03130 [Planctomycetaceae bacterium]